jgi:hypothetical protein
MRLEGLGQLKKKMASSRIKPATFHPVSRFLEQLRHRVPHSHISHTKTGRGGVPPGTPNLGKWYS